MSQGGILNGAVTPIGVPITKVGMQTGTSPVTADGAGLITFNGATVAAGTNPVRTDGTGAHTMALEVQISQAIASTDATKIGLAAFSSADFAVDANGFVTSLTGVSPWLDSAGGALVNDDGYFATAAAVYTLPAGLANGNMVEIVDFVGGGVVVTAQNGDKIRISNTDSSVNGTATSTQLGDALRLVYRLVGKVWVCAPSAGGMWLLG